MARVGVVSLTLCLLLLLPPIHCQDDEDTQDDYMYNFLNPVDRFDTEQYYKCPDENWVIGKFDNVVYCYQPFKYDAVNFPEDQDIHIVKNNYCRHLNNKSVIGNLHSRQEMLFVKEAFFRNVPSYRNYGNNDYLILGIYRLSGIQSTAIAYYPIDNLSLSYIYTLDKADVNARGKSIIKLDLNQEGYKFESASTAINANGNTAFLCKMKAEKREAYPALKNVNNTVDLFDYVCGDNSPGQYWEVAQNCGEIWCYLIVNTTAQGLYVNYPTEFNECGDLYPGANMASIHCKAEDEFMHRYDDGVIGFYKPYYIRTTLKEHYRWQDGTPVNYVNFLNDYSLNIYGRFLPDTIAKTRNNNYWNRPGAVSWRVCKAKARSKADAAYPYEEDFIMIATRTVNGTECGDFGRDAHHTQCPDTSWLKQQIGNETRCYKSISLNDVDAYLNNSLCQALYKTAKAASIESFLEEEFMAYQFLQLGIGLVPPPNATSAMLSEFVWTDGNKSGYKLARNYNWTQNGKKIVINLPYGPSNLVYDGANLGLCKMPALPLNQCHKPINAVLNPIGDYECPAGNWTMFKSCNQVNCYQTIPWPENSNGKDVMANNECGITLNNPKARVASIHCEREDRFIRGKFGKVFIGLKFNGTINDMPTWKWEDKTEFNYIPIEWERYNSRYEQHSYGDYNYRQAIDFAGKIFTTSDRGDNIWRVEGNTQLSIPVMCKIAATLKGSSAVSTSAPGQTTTTNPGQTTTPDGLGGG